jgi:hypothetical protein
MTWSGRVSRAVKVSLPVMGVDLVGKVGDGEPVGRGGEGGDRGQGGAGAGFVEVDTADPGPADDRRLG